ncbi:MAG: hypothetical protein SFU91_09515 [Chloroherpetonaceae bacterium]|nr:hypothetical protein [Chloroherpetonaceae bacterium]
MKPRYQSSISALILALLLGILSSSLASCEPTDPYQEMQDSKKAKYKDRLKKPYSGKKQEFGTPTKKEKSKEQE